MTSRQDSGKRGGRRLALVTTVIACVALVGGALPALTADNGAIVATVNVPLPPAPCITLDRTTVDFGTLPFSDPADGSTPIDSAFPSVHVGSCATAAEEIQLKASAATTTSGGVWHAPNTIQSNTCTYGLNFYIPGYADRYGAGRLYEPGGLTIRLHAISPGGDDDLSFRIQMPCRGSVGAGETASMTFSMLAVLV